MTWRSVPISIMVIADPPRAAEIRRSQAIDHPSAGRRGAALVSAERSRLSISHRRRAEIAHDAPQGRSEDTLARQVGGQENNRMNLPERCAF